MDLLLAVDYDVSPSAADFVRTWNADPVSADTAVARIDRHVEDLAVELLGAFLVTLGSIATGIATNAIYDLIKSKLKLPAGKKIDFEETTLPDGTQVTRVSITEES
jgi:hypothetical protein